MQQWNCGPERITNWNLRARMAASSTQRRAERCCSMAGTCNKGQDRTCPVFRTVRCRHAWTRMWMRTRGWPWPTFVRGHWIPKGEQTQSLMCRRCAAWTKAGNRHCVGGSGGCRAKRRNNTSEILCPCIGCAPRWTDKRTAMTTQRTPRCTSRRRKSQTHCRRNCLHTGKKTKLRPKMPQTASWRKPCGQWRRCGRRIGRQQGKKRRRRMHGPRCQRRPQYVQPSKSKETSHPARCWAVRWQTLQSPWVGATQTKCSKFTRGCTA